jgi:EmrB/QacA subfamily drug resistance transporter
MAGVPATARKRQLLTLGACCFGLFMVMLDNTVVNVALPSLQRELEATVSGLALVLDAYILVFASLLLTAGSLGDRFGRRRVFRAGLVVFTASSALCGLAPTLPALVGGRALQAVGAAALLPSSLAILTDAVPDPRERVQAIGLWSGVSAMALAAGPVIGGLLTDALGWRWVFYVNLPVGVAAYLVAGRVVADARDPAASRLDLPGLALGSLGLGAVTLGLIESSRRGWRAPEIVGLLAAGAALLAGFVAVEGRQRWPMLSLRFFGDGAFTAANVVVLLAGFALLGFVFFNTLYFQAVQGWSPLQAGLRSLPNTLAVVVAAPLAGRLASRYGYRLPVVAGLCWPRPPWPSGRWPRGCSCVPGGPSRTPPARRCRPRPPEAQVAGSSPSQSMPCSASQRRQASSPEARATPIPRKPTSPLVPTWVASSSPSASTTRS